MNWKKWGPVAAVGAAAAAVVTFVAVKSKASPNTPAALTGANPISMLPDSPATPSRTVGPIATGTVVTFNLPAGGTWVSLTTPGGSAIPVSGAKSAAVQINGSGAMVGVYSDASGQHTSTTNFTTA